MAALLIVGASRAVTMDPARTVLTEAAVAVDGGRIAAIGPVEALRRAHPGADELDAAGGWLLPGMVDAHQHLTGDRLARASIPDDLAPGESIFSWAVACWYVPGNAPWYLSVAIASVRSVSFSSASSAPLAG